MSALKSSTGIYLQGDVVLQHPIEASTVVLFVIFLSSILEFFIDFASEVENKYFRVMFDAVNQEVMIVGVLVLSMNFAQTLYDWPSQWIAIFQWAMMCLFFMAVFFVIIVLLVLLFVNISMKKWKAFEITEMDSSDPTLMSKRESQYCASVEKFHQALVACGYDPTMKGIQFADYLGKLVRKNIVSLTDLSWISWICLATLVIVNTLRSEATRRIANLKDENIEDAMSVSQRLGHYLSFIIIVGYGTLGGFLAVYIILSRRLDEFNAGKVTGAQGEGGEDGGGEGSMGVPLMETGNLQRHLTKDALEDPRAKLFRRSREATLEIVQVLILFLEWYTSFFFLSFSNEAFMNLGYASIPIYLVAAVPVIVMTALVPWLATMLTLLSCLGTSLDDSVVQHMIIKAGVPESEWPAPMRAVMAKREAEGGSDGDEDGEEGSMGMLDHRRRANRDGMNMTNDTTRSGGKRRRRGMSYKEAEKQEQRHRESSLFSADSGSPRLSRPLPEHDL